MVKQTLQNDVVLDELAIMAKVMSLSDPWYVMEIIYDKNAGAVIVKIDFTKGAVFHFESLEASEAGDYKVYDSRIKHVRHFNYAQYPLYLDVRVPRIKISTNKIGY